MKEAIVYDVVVSNASNVVWVQASKEPFGVVVVVVGGGGGGGSVVIRPRENLDTVAGRLTFVGDGVLVARK